MSSSTLTSPVQTESLPEQLIEFTLFHKRDTLRSVTFRFKATGYEIQKHELLNHIYNPHSGHELAVLLRNRWDKKRLGKLDDWRDSSLTITDIASTADASIKKKGVVLLDSKDHTAQTTTCESLAGSFDGKQEWSVVGGQADLAAQSDAKFGYGQVISVKWFTICKSDRLPPFDAENPQQGREERKAIVMEALRAGWDTGKYGPLSDFKLRKATFRYFMPEHRDHLYEPPTSTHTFANSVGLAKN